jgi:hypothetical protein
MSKMYKVLHVLGQSKSLYNKTKFTNYPTDEFRMDFYMKMTRTLIRKGNIMFTILKGQIYDCCINNQHVGI